LKLSIAASNAPVLRENGPRLKQSRINLVRCYTAETVPDTSALAKLER
jgi:hypothetical protein